MTTPPRDPVKTARIELRYLARVGAYRYLDVACDLLRGPLGVEPPLVPSDEGLVPCGCDACRHVPVVGKNGRRGHDVGAFRVYAAAETDALDALKQITDPTALELIPERITLGLAEGERVRASLLRRGHPVPGRGAWLVPSS